MTPWILPVAIIFLLVAFVVIHNRLVQARNRCDEAWSNVDTELKRRYDLIPRLVNTVKGHARHERELLERVAHLREECVRNIGAPRSQAASENQLVEGLNALIARVEAYPDLKASGSFLQLQEELVSAEDRLQAAWRFYNGNVRESNNRVESFPSSLVAGLFGFARREFFRTDDVNVGRAPDVGLASTG